jgi:hypothetical protein
MYISNEFSLESGLSSATSSQQVRGGGGEGVGVDWWVLVSSVCGECAQSCRQVAAGAWRVWVWVWVLV